MTAQKKKICIMLAGGTWTLAKNKEVLMVNQEEDVAPWLDTMPELNILADTKVVFLSGEEEIVGPELWEKMAKFISSQVKNYDSFIIVSKVEQLILTANALTFLLQNINKTIVLTGAQMSGLYLRDKKELTQNLLANYGGFSLRANLINALQVATETLPRPSIMFGSRLVLGTKASLERQKNNYFFSSLDNDYLAKVDFGISLKSDLSYPKKATKIFSKINSKLLILDNSLSDDWSSLKNIAKNYQGILIKMQREDLTTAQSKIIKDLNIPCVFYHPVYLNPAKFAIHLVGCSWEAAIAKTLWVVSNFNKPEEVAVKIASDIAGEFLNI